MPPQPPKSQPRYEPGNAPVTPLYGMAAVPSAPPVQRSWWHRLPPLGKAALISTGALVLCCGGLVTLGAIAGPPDPARTPGVNAAASSPQSEPLAPVGGESSPTPPASPVIEKQTVTETQSIPYTTKTVNDSSLPKGTTTVRTKGVEGIKTLTYEVTYTDGVETDRKLVSEIVTKEPVS